METILICGAFLFIYMLIFRIPVAFAVGMSALMYPILMGKIPLEAFPHRYAFATESWPLMAVPFFILLGKVLNEGKSGIALMDFVNRLVGSLWGGLASVSVVLNMFMGGCSGSSVADAAGIGGVLIPEMIRKGYGKAYSAAVNTCASTIGIIIPPSIPMIIYAWMTEVSIRKLFLAGIIPGILISCSQMFTAALLGYKRGYYRSGRASAKETLEKFKKSIPSLFTLIIVLGGILFGFYNTTEAAIIGAVYVILIELFIYKGLKISQLFPIFIDSAKITGVVMFVISTSFSLSYISAVNRIPQMIESRFFPLIPNATIALLAITILLLIVGCFLDLVPALLIFTPIIVPLCIKFGVDLIQLGIIITIILAIGLITPPVGQCLYVSTLIAGEKLETIAKDCIYFIISILAVLFLIMIFPPVTLWLSKY